MGRYCKWDDIVARYARVPDVGGAKEVDDNHIYYAEHELDSRLGGSFTVPFSSNNVTAKDLAIDMTYLRLIKYKEPKRAKDVRADIDARIEALVGGDMPMLTTSGAALFPDDDGGAWSSTQDYHPTFGLEDYSLSHVSSSMLQDEEDSRW